MSEFLSDVRDEIRNIIIATAAGATEDNVFASIAAARMNLVERIRAGRVTLPIWVMDADSATPFEWGAANESYRIPVTIVEIRAAGGTDVQSQIKDSLTLLQREIFNDPHTYFQAIERGRIDTSIDAPAVDALLDATLNAVAGMLIYTPGVLCGDFNNE